jgi:hypothetical protein
LRLVSISYDFPVPVTAEVNIPLVCIVGLSDKWLSRGSGSAVYGNLPAMLHGQGSDLPKWGLFGRSGVNFRVTHGPVAGFTTWVHAELGEWLL